MACRQATPAAWSHVRDCERIRRQHAGLLQVAAAWVQVEAQRHNQMHPGGRDSPRMRCTYVAGASCGESISQWLASGGQLVRMPCIQTEDDDAVQELAGDVHVGRVEGSVDGVGGRGRGARRGCGVQRGQRMAGGERGVDVGKESW